MLATGSENFVSFALKKSNTSSWRKPSIAGLSLYQIITGKSLRRAFKTDEYELTTFQKKVWNW